VAFGRKAGAVLLVAGVIVLLSPLSAAATGNGHTPVTICHGVPAAEDQPLERYVRIVVDNDSWKIEGHKAHPKDVLLEGDVPCPPVPSPSPSVTPSPTPTPTPSETITPSPTPTPTPTVTPSPSPRKTPSATPTPAPTPSVVPATLPHTGPGDTLGLAALGSCLMAAGAGLLRAARH